VFALWVLPESPWALTHSAFSSFYNTWLVLPPGRLPEFTGGVVYAPDACGWPLALVRLLGSAVVIAVAEEFFWRGFLYRWLIDRDFTSVDPGLFRLGAFLAVSLVFGLEHHRWFAGLLAGCAYGALYIRTRNLWAAVTAHVTTNLLLGLYVLASGAYRFW
jgi:CAAX prenyl protease-like protein